MFRFPRRTPANDTIQRSRCYLHMKDRVALQQRHLSLAQQWKST